MPFINLFLKNHKMNIQSEVEEMNNFSISDEKYKTVTQKCNEILENAKGNE